MIFLTKKVSNAQSEIRLHAGSAINEHNTDQIEKDAESLRAGGKSLRKTLPHHGVALQSREQFAEHLGERKPRPELEGGLGLWLRFTLAGWASASAVATSPPREWPMTVKRSMPSLSSTPATIFTNVVSGRPAEDAR